MMLAFPTGSQRSAASAPWLHELGLRFDPFEYLDASADLRLSDYVVGQEAFAIAWDDVPALIFAPAGGGKTAMRIYATRACWVALGGSHPFPIPYTLSNHRAADRPPTPEAHLREIMRLGARVLLIGLLFRPERLLQLRPDDRRTVVALLERVLQGGLRHYLEIACADNGLFELQRRLAPGYILPNQPSQAAILACCRAIEAALPVVAAASPIEGQFESLLSVLFDLLGFRSIYLMLDALDAFPETLHAPEVALAWMEWLLEQTAPWAARRIFLKGFLPIETEAAFAARAAVMAPALRFGRLNWNIPMLAELIRRRVYVASDGEFGSLDAICSPDLRDIETMLMKALPVQARLPREALILVRRMLQEYAQRPERQVGKLTGNDFDAAIHWYQSQLQRSGE